MKNVHPDLNDGIQLDYPGKEGRFQHSSDRRDERIVDSRGKFTISDRAYIQNRSISKEVIVTMFMNETKGVSGGGRLRPHGTSYGGRS